MKIKNIALFLLLGLSAAIAGNYKNTPRPSAAEIAKLQTITLFYKITDEGLELNWTPANSAPSGGIKITASADQPQPLYPQDGYVVWLPGTGHSSCVIPFRKARLSKPKYFRVCSVKSKNHREHVALSNVVIVPAVSKKDSGNNKNKSKKYKKPKSTDEKKYKSTQKKNKTAKAPDAADSSTPAVTDIPAARAAKRPAGALIIGHDDTALEKVPLGYINKAKKELSIWYGHTSHGSQITSGMQAMNSAPYNFNTSGSGGALRYVETGGDLGHNGNDRWMRRTREYLQGGGGANVIVWSWCGGCSNNTVQGINRYLQMMDGLEKDYPDRVFVYMTGHLDGSGVDGNLHRMNQAIRAFCRKNNKVLFDFADIESYDPDGNYFLDKNARDTCDYRSRSARGNWAREWLARNPDHKYKLPASAAHTHPLNAALKGQAFWVMLARLAGWNG